MTREAEWRAEWDVLRAERADARRRWRGAADDLAVRARDPLGFGALVRSHPIAATAIGAAAAALVAKLFLRSAPRDDASDGDATSNGHAAVRPAPAWSALLRDAALGIAVPWLLRVIKEKLGWDASPDAAPEPHVTRRSGTEPPAPSPRA